MTEACIVVKHFLDIYTSQKC